MLRWSLLSVAVAIALLIGCGSASEEALFGPPNPNAWTGVRGSGGDAATGGSGAAGGTESTGGANGGSDATGGISNTGGVSTGGVSPSGGAGGLDPSTGGSSTEIGSPGVISCAGIPCRSDMMPANTCCLGGLQTACRPEYVTCSINGASSFHCDDAADCGGGAICCVSAAGSTVMKADCVTECAGSGSTLQLCRTNAECPEGQECKPWNKLPDYGACQ